MKYMPHLGELIAVTPPCEASKPDPKKRPRKRKRSEAEKPSANIETCEVEQQETKHTEEKPDTSAPAQTDMLMPSQNSIFQFCEVNSLSTQFKMSLCIEFNSLYNENNAAYIPSMHQHNQHSYQNIFIKKQMFDLM